MGTTTVTAAICATRSGPGSTSAGRPARTLPRKEWLATVVDAGWAVPTWPTEWYGRGLDGDDGRGDRRGVPPRRCRRAPAQDKHNLWANTMLAFGTDELKQQFVRRLLIDDVKMCLLYSEPGAGSDLAGLQTRADRDGDEWVVNGQKVWTSGGKEAEFGMLIARTNWDVPKHQGISFFWCPMDQPGVEVRPIRQITGEAHFNEVFLDDVRVPAHHLVGPLDGGWRVLQTALAYERSVMGDMARGPRSGQQPPARRRPADARRRVPARRRRDPARPRWTCGRWRSSWAATRTRRSARRSPGSYELRKVNEWNGLRAKAAARAGLVVADPVARQAGDVADPARGRPRAAPASSAAEALLDGPANPLGDDANFLSLNAFFTSIGGGTDQIQRNIIGERVLGLPREPEVDRDVRVLARSPRPR